MKLSVHKDQIIDGLQKAAAIIPSRAGTAFLRSLWLKAENGYLSIMSTDTDIEFTGKYPAEVDEPGLIGVPGRAFCDLIGKFPSGVLDMAIDKEGSALLVKRGKSRYRLPITTSDWFQELSPYPESEGVAWAGDFLLDLLERITFCIDDDDSRDALACLCFKPRGNGRVDACGLNGHQFAMVSFIHDELCERLPENCLLIQRKYLADIKKWLVPDEIELNFDDKRVYFKRQDGAEMLSLPRPDYEYPDYNVFMSKVESEDVSKLDLPRVPAIESLQRILVFNSENYRYVYLDLSEQELGLSASAGDGGSGNEFVDVNYSGKIKRIAFSTKALLEIFNHFSSENLNISFTDVDGPCGIWGVDDREYTVIIMPMKISDENFFEAEEEE